MTRQPERSVLPLLPRREERGGERRGIFARVSPLPSPLPARSSQGEGEDPLSPDRLVQWHCSPALSPLVPRGEREKRKRRQLLVPLSPILRTPRYGNEILAVRPETGAHLAHRRQRERTGQGFLSGGLCRAEESGRARRAGRGGAFRPLSGKHPNGPGVPQASRCRPVVL